MRRRARVVRIDVRRADLSAERLTRYDLRLFNTLTRREEEFAPAQGDGVRMYTCGLTVYARGHIGNFRTFVALDVLRRVLEFEGYTVRQVRNYTDVDDRTIAESVKAGQPLREYTQQFVEAFERDAASLGLEPVEYAPRATDHIEAMAGMIQALERNGHTYESDGSIYFKIATFPEYGRLARLDHGGIKSGARVDTDKYDKENARDFVLWKARQGGGAVVGAGAARRAGRAGTSSVRRWPRSCSAMPIDIHGGGVDLIFPHHENEIAQAEGATGRQFSRFWVHVEHLMIEEESNGAEKMSKSLGNVYSLEDVIAQGFRPSTLRFLYLGTHYRKQLKFSWSAMAQAEEAVKRLTDFLARLDGLPAGPASPSHRRRACRQAATTFRQHVGDDLNTAAGLGEVFDLVRALNSAIDAGELRSGDAARSVRAFEQFDRVLGILALRRAEDDAAAGADRRNRAPIQAAPRRTRRTELRRSG